MRSVLRASKWTAAALAIALCAVTADARAQNHRHSGSGGGNNNSGGGGGKVYSGGGGGGKVYSGGGAGKLSTGGSGKLNAGGGKLNAGGGAVGKLNAGGAGKNSGGVRIVDKFGTGGTGNNGRTNTGAGGKNNGGVRIVDKFGTGGGNAGKTNTGGTKIVDRFGTGGAGRIDKRLGRDGWDRGARDGWDRLGWNSAFNWERNRHHHGYWNAGVWIPPWVVTQNVPVVYLEPVQPIVTGHKWLGVTYQPYAGGGAYVTGIYEGSPAQQVGLAVGDVIVALDGNEATNLGNAVQAANDVAQLQILSGRTGDLLQAEVNLIY